MEKKRIHIKYIRDYIKKNYQKKDECYICGVKDTLEFHHIFGLSDMFSNWLKKNKIHLDDTVEQIKILRVQFEQDNLEALDSKNAFTLCKKHHERLHNMYGQVYPNGIGEKVRRWVIRQKEKNT